MSRRGSLAHGMGVGFAAVLGLIAGAGHAQPSNDFFANRIAFAGTNVFVSGSNVGATREAGEPYHAGQVGGGSVWWSWTAPSAGTVTITTAGSSFDTLLGIYLGSSVSGLTEVASNDEDPDSFLTSKVSFDVEAGLTYAIAVDGYWGDMGSVTLHLYYSVRPPNDQFANQIVIIGTNTVVTGTSVGATREPGEPYHAGYTGGHSVWWLWTAPSVGTVTVSTAGSSFDTLLGVYVGSSVSALTEVASNDEDPDGYLTSKVVFDVTAGQTYAIAVDGYYGAAGDIRLQVLLGPIVPPPPAPGWLLLDPYGQPVSSTNFAGKVVVLNFWATWCGPCLAELPDLVDLQGVYGADGLVIVGADVPWGGDTVAAVQSFLATYTPAINYPVVMANSLMMQAYGGIDAIPATFIIDRGNLIRKHYLGSQSRNTFERQIIPLLYGGTRLTLQRNGDQAILRWPVSALTFTLETSALAQPVWTNWPALPTVSDGSNTVVVPLTDSARFFRLRMPY